MDPWAVITDRFAEEATLRGAIQQVYSVPNNEGPSFWLDVVGDEEYSDRHRMLCFYMYFRRHVPLGTKLRDLLNAADVRPWLSTASAYTFASRHAFSTACARNPEVWTLETAFSHRSSGGTCPCGSLSLAFDEPHFPGLWKWPEVIGMVDQGELDPIIDGISFLGYDYSPSRKYEIHYLDYMCRGVAEVVSQAGEAITADMDRESLLAVVRTPDVEDQELVQCLRRIHRLPCREGADFWLAVVDDERFGNRHRARCLCEFLRRHVCSGTQLSQLVGISRARWWLSCGEPVMAPATQGRMAFSIAPTFVKDRPLGERSVNCVRGHCEIRLGFRGGLPVGAVWQEILDRVERGQLDAPVDAVCFYWSDGSQGYHDFVAS